MHIRLDFDDPFVEMERAFGIIEELERGRRRILSARRIALTAVLAVGTILLSVLLGTPLRAASSSL